MQRVRCCSTTPRARRWRWSRSRAATDMVSAADHASEELLVTLLAGRAAGRRADRRGGRRARRHDRPDAGWSTRSTAPPTTSTGCRSGRCPWPSRTTTVRSRLRLRPARDEAVRRRARPRRDVNGRADRDGSGATVLATSLIGTGFAYTADVRAAPGRARCPTDRWPRARHPARRLGGARPRLGRVRPARRLLRDRHPALGLRRRARCSCARPAAASRSRPGRTTACPQVVARRRASTPCGRWPVDGDPLATLRVQKARS